MSANDRELLSEYAHRGSEAAFRELVSRYAALVYGTAFRHLQDRALAEDVSQVSFVRLAQAAPELKETVNVAGWLYRTARHVSLNMARTRSREERRAQQHADLNSKATAALEDRETIVEASDALVVMGPTASACVPTLLSQLGSWRDYFIFKVLRVIEPAAILDALSLPASAAEAAAALGELGPEGAWALPALRAALTDASPDSADPIAAAIAAIEAPEGLPLMGRIPPPVP
jgi:RNA polymerase sigma factor (sigma-70 family)